MEKFTQSNINYQITGENTVQVGHDNATAANGFAGLVCLSSLTIPQNIVHNSKSYKPTRISQKAFSDCKNLVTISLPDSIEYIGYDSFARCPIKSDSFVLPSALEEIYSYAFACSAIKEFVLPISLKRLGSNPFHSRNTFSITIPIANAYFSVDENHVLYDSLFTIVYFVPHNLSFQIPDTVVRIAPFAFAYTSMTYLNIPQNTQMIDGYAFGYSNLKCLTISGNLVQYFIQSFSLMSLLEKINYLGKRPVVSSIKTEKEILIVVCLDYRGKKFGGKEINRTSACPFYNEYIHKCCTSKRSVSLRAFLFVLSFISS